MSVVASARVAFVAALGVLLIGCGGGSGAPPPAETLHASWTIDELSVRRGEVRVSGAVDVDPEAGDLELVDGSCARRSLGGGIWTRSKLVWRFSANDIAAALGCSSRFGLRAKRSATSAASVSSFVAVRLDFDIEHDGARPRFVRSVRHEFDGDDAVLKVLGVRGRSVTLAALGTNLGPINETEDAATFRLPTSSLVVAALRQSPIRLVSGRRHARVHVTLHIDHQLVTSTDSESEESPESS